MKGKKEREEGRGGKRKGKKDGKMGVARTALVKKKRKRITEKDGRRAWQNGAWRLHTLLTPPSPPPPPLHRYELT